MGKPPDARNVMAARVEARDGLDDFPTPCWATRALIEHVIRPITSAHLHAMTAWEPAANRGHMVRPLKEYFGSVKATDIADYGSDYPITDFLSEPANYGIDWVITNPPFNLAEQFAWRARTMVPNWKGIALLTRTSFLEGVGRHQRLFSVFPPQIVAQFVERVPMFKGRLTATGSTATAYCWLVWLARGGETKLRWIPPCRRALEKPGDYNE